MTKDPWTCARGCVAISSQRRSERRVAGSLRLCCLPLLVGVCLLGSHPAHSQEIETPPATNTIVETETAVAKDAIVSTKTAPGKQPAENEISVMAMVPDGDYRLFSATVRCYAWTVGLEYDRSWGHFLKSRVDYVAEILPVVILSQPAVSDFWGNAKSPNQQRVYGVSLSPFGFRFLWRSNKAVKPYMIGKLGSAAFTKKAFSPNDG